MPETAEQEVPALLAYERAGLGRKLWGLLVFFALLNEVMAQLPHQTRAYQPVQCNLPGYLT